MQETRDVQTHHAAHDGGDAEDHGRQVDGEAGVVVRHEGVEGDADGFAAGDNGEGVEGDGEEEGGGAGQAGGEDGEEGEEEGGGGGEGEFGGGVLCEEGGGGVGVVGVFAVEDCSLGSLEGNFQKRE